MFPPLYADVAHLVERHLAKVEVAGSSPVIRSIKSVQLMYWFFYFTDFFAKQGARRGEYYPPASKRTYFVIVIQYRSSDNNEIPLTEYVYSTQQKVTILNRDLVFYEFLAL